MKAIIKVEKEVEIKYVKLQVAVRYDEEDMPSDFPHRKNDFWSPTIDVDNGQILEWEKGRSIDLHMKVCDDGSYYLLDGNKNLILSIEQDYVPNKLIPGEYGDYIIMNINENGIITNWKSNPSISDFTEDED